MTIEQVTTDRLESVSAVTNLVGTRIYQLKLRQNTQFPAIRVQLISDPRDYHLRGEIDLGRARVQIDSYGLETGADPYGAVAAVADAVEVALSGVVFTVGGFKVKGAFQIFRRALHEPGTQPLIRIHQDFRFRYSRV